jgi:hypothetical protein
VVCPLCGHDYFDDARRSSGTEFGRDVDGCELCLDDLYWWGNENPDATSGQVVDYARRLAEVLQRVPPSNVQTRDLFSLPFERRVRAFTVVRSRPSVTRVKTLFGSWLATLIEAGVVGDAARRTARGTQSIALDGHVCLSLGERTIDDLLFRLGIAHTREDKYPDERHRSDFLIGRIHLEYLGLAGDAAYDAKTQLKQSLAEQYGLKLELVTVEDLLDPDALAARLIRLASN